MRIAKILIALVAIVAAGLLVAIHFYRDTVALEIANRALRGQDVVVTDVSVDAIGAEAVSFSKIDVETADGARIRVEGVTLPVGILGLRGERFVIDRLRIDPGSAGDEAPAVAAILETVLAIPQQVTGVFVDAAELSVAGYPTIVDVSWSLAASSQAIRATIDRFYGDADDRLPGRRSLSERRARRRKWRAGRCQPGSGYSQEAGFGLQHRRRRDGADAAAVANAHVGRPGFRGKSIRWL